MKKYGLILLMVAGVLSIFITGCKKDNPDNPDNPNSGEAIATGTIDAEGGTLATGDRDYFLPGQVAYWFWRWAGYLVFLSYTVRTE